jgi:hypothetical protein
MGSVIIAINPSGDLFRIGNLVFDESRQFPEMVAFRVPVQNDAPSWLTRAAQSTCPFRKLNPTVLMVKSAQDVASDDAAAALNRSAMWGIFLQAEMGPCRVVISGVEPMIATAALVGERRSRFA